LLTKVEAGELDAGIVYQTDVQAAGDTVEGVEIPADVNVVATYPIAPVAASANPDAAEVFVAFVQSSEGQGILASYGFLQP
jgi:molybdate transport system substrate-binding protein